MNKRFTVDNGGGTISSIDFCIQKQFKVHINSSYKSVHL